MPSLQKRQILYPRLSLYGSSSAAEEGLRAAVEASTSGLLTPVESDLLLRSALARFVEIEVGDLVQNWVWELTENWDRLIEKAVGGTVSSSGDWHSGSRRRALARSRQ